jgi:uncharacterized membrane protein YkvA (DUF1232 family)
MTTPLSTPLDRFLAQKPDAGGAFLPSHYVERGAACVGEGDLTRLPRLLPQLRQKAALIDSKHLRQRIEILVQCATRVARTDDESAARRESAFALFYLLKGYDLVPDSIPEVGFLDDMQIVDAVFRRHARLLDPSGSLG